MALDLDRYVLQPCMAVWGYPVTFHGPTDPPLVVRAVFDDRYRESKFDDLVGEVVSQRPMLNLRAAAFRLGLARRRVICSPSPAASTSSPTHPRPTATAT